VLRSAANTCARTCSRWRPPGLSKFYDWRKRYGKLNEHNAQVPRDHWLTEEEKRAILDYERQYPLEDAPRPVNRPRAGTK
jgi:putative transposase